MICYNVKDMVIHLRDVRVMQLFVEDALPWGITHMNASHLISSVFNLVSFMLLETFNAQEKLTKEEHWTCN